MSHSEEVEFWLSDENVDFTEPNECDSSNNEEDDCDHEAHNSDSSSYGSTDGDDSLSKTYGNITVNVKKANIIRQKVDVIVNSTAQNLDLTQGAASRTILKKGGKSIQRECNSKYCNGLQSGDIAVTKAGRLSHKEIYHLFLPKWNGSNRNTAVQDAMVKCLQTASSSGHTSIAFPALGTGNLGYDKDYVAKIMFNTVDRFSKENSSSSLKTVNFVLYPSDYGTIESFTEFCQQTTFDMSGSNSSASSSSSSSPVVTRSSPGIRRSASASLNVRELSTRLEGTLVLLPDNKCKIGNITISVISGSLADQNTDVLMTSCTRGLDLKRGTLSKSVSDGAGPSLQSECNQKYPRGIQHGEIAVLGSANLNCKKVYCGALPRYDRPEPGTEPLKVLEQLITACLKQVSKDGMKSISFPLLGCGYLKYPDSLASKTMFTSINKFWISNSSTSLRTVNMVVFEGTESSRAHKQAYMNEVKSWKKKPPTAPKPPLSIATPVPFPRLRPKSATPGRNTPEYCRLLYSRDIYPPDTWTAYKSNKTVRQWKIDEKDRNQYTLVNVGGAEFNKVDRLVKTTWESSKKGHGRDAGGLDQLNYDSLKVTNIQRIENLNLYEDYGNKKRSLFFKASQCKMFTKLSDIEGLSGGPSRVDKYLDKTWRDSLHSEVNEGYFFHGTKKDRIDGVVKLGLDPRMAQGEAVLGKAIYMAESSTKADQYADSRGPNRSSQGLQMFLVRACLGKINLMKKVHKMLRPPCCVQSCSDDGCNHDDRYDSIIVEDQYIFREFVLYDHHQVYPEYLITYDRV